MHFCNPALVGIFDFVRIISTVGINQNKNIMEKNTYLLDIHACFYLQVLEKFDEMIDEFDKTAFISDTMASDNNALSNFLSPQNVNILLNAMISVTEDPNQKIEELEMAFLKKIIFDYLQSGIIPGFEEIRSELYVDEWYASIVYSTSCEYADLIREDYEWYAEYISGDECIEMFQEFFLSHTYLVRSQERGHIEISKLAIGGRNLLVLIFNHLQLQERAN